MRHGRVWRWLLVATLIILSAGSWPPGVARAAEAEYSCDEMGLDAALAAGGTATFACLGPTTVVTTTAKVIRRDVILDGGGLLTVHNGPAVQSSVFYVEGFEPSVGNRNLKVTFRGLTMSGGTGFNSGLLNGGGFTIVAAPCWWSIA